MNQQDKHLQALIGVAIGMITGSASEAIEAIEKMEQSHLVSNSELPIEGDWDVLEAWGVKKLEPSDDLFVNCILPEGWTKEPKNHYWTSLKDEKGHNRASIFYKGVSYDRRAHFRVHYPCFYVVQDYDYSDDSDDRFRRFCIKDVRTDSIVWQGEKFVLTSYGCEAYLQAEETAKAKLKELYPDNDNPLAYWD